MCEQLFEFLFRIYIYDNFGPIWLFTATFGDINSGNFDSNILHYCKQNKIQIKRKKEIQNEFLNFFIFSNLEVCEKVKLQNRVYPWGHHSNQRQSDCPETT